MEFGIFPHLAAGRSRPLASVAMHPAESTFDGLIEEKLKEYHSARIGETTKMSFQEYLNLSYPVGKRILAACRLILQQELEAKKKALDKTEAELGTPPDK